MSEIPTSLFDRFLALPRVMQWALLAALGMTLFLAWDSYIAPISDSVGDQANSIAAHVQEVRDSRKLAEDLDKDKAFKNVVRGIGSVRPPRNAAAGSAAFTDVVNDLMKKHAITDQDFSLRSRGKLPKNALVQTLRGKRAERLTGDLKFSAKPEVALDILAELESSPDIEQVASVRLTKDQNGKVKVHYVVEAWVIASEGSTQASGGPA